MKKGMVGAVLALSIVTMALPQAFADQKPQGDQVIIVDPISGTIGSALATVSGATSSVTALIASPFITTTAANPREVVLVAVADDASAFLAGQQEKTSLLSLVIEESRREMTEKLGADVAASVDDARIAFEIVRNVQEMIQKQAQ